MRRTQTFIFFCFLRARPLEFNIWRFGLYCTYINISCNAHAFCHAATSMSECAADHKSIQYARGARRVSLVRFFGAHTQSLTNYAYRVRYILQWMWHICCSIIYDRNTTCGAKCEHQSGYFSCACGYIVWMLVDGLDASGSCNTYGDKVIRNLWRHFLRRPETYNSLSHNVYDVIKTFLDPSS